jgi:hypothetical protein
MAMASPTWRTTSRASPYCGAWRRSNFTPAASPGGGAPNSGKRLHPALEVGEREDGRHTGQGARGADVEPGDAGVRVRRAQESRVQEARQRDVVDEAPLTAEEARIFAPPDGGAEVLGAQLLLAVGEEPVQPGRGGGHEQARDRHAADSAEDGQEHQ